MTLFSTGSILVLRLTLLVECLVTNPSDREDIASKSVTKLFKLLDNVEGAGITEVVKTLNLCLERMSQRSFKQGRRSWRTCWRRACEQGIPFSLEFLAQYSWQQKQFYFAEADLRAGDRQRTPRNVSVPLYLQEI
ncbi:hypothetical protein K7X08_021632 [Anisodus acutangulus]|uniref:Uncharacterized protein n=1 Tax=Anisodus acutangulus TaxID=402998 RepID=A0A9Q1RDF1_9SOLA|nr:hypothetical protein K7X08_021632 [Anisodus acutangulus]